MLEVPTLWSDTVKPNSLTGEVSWVYVWKLCVKRMWGWQSWSLGSNGRYPRLPGGLLLMHWQKNSTLNEVCLHLQHIWVRVLLLTESFKWLTSVTSPVKWYVLCEVSACLCYPSYNSITPTGVTTFQVIKCMFGVIARPNPLSMYTDVPSLVAEDLLNEVCTPTRTWNWCCHGDSECRVIPQCSVWNGGVSFFFLQTWSHLLLPSRYSC